MTIDLTGQSTPPAGAPFDDAGGEQELQPGATIGQFRVEARIGHGGMSTVYSAVQPLIGKKAAIKVMKRDLCLDPTQVDRFVQEARAVNQIGHPNIVDVFSFGTLPDGRSYHVMEWLPGETLAERLSRGPVAVNEGVAIIFQICDALAAAHDKGIVHRDLKPENVFLMPVRNRRLLVKLLDFGVAKLRGPYQQGHVAATAPGLTVGTPKYMAPEQARGKEVDYRADVYALGVTAYEMFTGRVPFLGTEAFEVMHQHVHAQPPAPSSFRPDLPTQLERLLLAMLDKKPDERPTLAQIEARLADIRDGLPLADRDSGPIALRGLESTADGAPRHVTSPSPQHITGPSARQLQPTEDMLPLMPPRQQRILTAILGLVALGGAAAAMGVVLGKPPRPAEKPAPALVAARPTPTPPTVAPAPQPVADDKPVVKPAALLIAVNVADAKVALDGKLLSHEGPSPRIVLADPGEHTLDVTAPRYRPYHHVWNVAAGAEERVAVNLERQGASARSAPAAASTGRDGMIDPFAR